jgi:hypothetical protein
MSEVSSNDERFAAPIAVTPLDMAFGGRIADLMPGYRDLPEEFRRERDPYTKHVHSWFFNGMDKRAWTSKQGIDAEQAWQHLRAIMASFEPSHEQKIAGVAWLMSRWFHPLTALRESQP